MGEQALYCSMVVERNGSPIEEHYRHHHSLKLVASIRVEVVLVYGIGKYGVDLVLHHRPKVASSLGIAGSLKIVV